MTMLNRRTLFASTVAAAGAAKEMFGTTPAHAGLPKGSDVEPRGANGRLERLPRLDLESTHDFITGFRQFVNGQMSRSAESRINAILKSKGLDPNGDLPFETILEHTGKDPVVANSARSWLSAQQISWRTLYNEFHGNADAYMAEMEAADKAGPGTLELNPDMKPPAYTTHEIHIQPGGYVGDAFAGHMYLYGTNNFYTGRNNQDELHIAYAGAVPVPKDGKVLRILDQGTSCGQLAVALKQRFPTAEVWAIDVGGPMVRFAHMRAADLGVEVHFAQRLAEDSKFPDNHFDIVTNNIMFHEVTQQGARDILKESLRVLRPGGVYYPMDFYTGTPPPKTAYGKFRQWWDMRWNGEPWRLDYAALDFNGAMREAGFEVNENGPPSRPGAKRNVLGTKPA
jgi:SAM-dependent methyltransferase